MQCFVNNTPVEDDSFLGYALNAINALMMEAVRTSETSVCFNKTTRRYIPESCHLHSCRREKVKSHSKWCK
jgi:hypothetical protein